MARKDALTCGIALCTFNGLSYLDEQLTSLLAQDRQPDRVVIYDDGSNDGTWEVIKEWAQRAPLSVSVHQQSERVGYVRNFEAAVQAMDTDLIFLCDQDDVWLPHKIALMAQAFEDQPDLLLCIPMPSWLTPMPKTLGFPYLTHSNCRNSNMPLY